MFAGALRVMRVGCTLRCMQTLGDLGEFGLIARIERLAQTQSLSGVRLGIGDDAAVLKSRPGEDVIVSTDAMVEGVHFRWRNQSPQRVGRRSLVANLSDLAAMGARPRGFTMALAAPPSLPVTRVDGLVRGLVREAVRWNCPLVGGNVTRSRTTSINLTVIGTVPAASALRRQDLRVGDRLCVTGSLGGAALATHLAERRGAEMRRLAEPRLVAGQALRRLHGHGACIDVSDGLLADLSHLVRASGCGALVEPGAIPRPRGFAVACARAGVNADRLVWSGGEDYELLFSVRADAPPTRELTRRFKVPVTEVGRVISGEGIQGIPRDISSEGWSHF